MEYLLGRSAQICSLSTHKLTRGNIPERELLESSDITGRDLWMFETGCRVVYNQ